MRYTGRIVAFDVETPNSHNDRISSIGITVVENGIIADNLYYLVNPETYFDMFNVQLTGITPEMAKNSPNFYELWKTIGPIMGSGLLLAHNAPFDMSVLAKCLRDYRISRPLYVNYACTCQIGRRVLPHCRNHRLNTLCSYLDICLDHHNAGSDSLACAKLMQYYMASGVNLRHFIRTYDMINIKTLTKR